MKTAAGMKPNRCYSDITLLLEAPVQLKPTMIPIVKKLRVCGIKLHQDLNAKY